MGNPILRSVQTDLPEAPYPDDTKANGFKQEVDWDRIRQSRSWVMADAETRPWLLVIWLQSWANVPVGSWENDEEFIARCVGASPSWFKVHREELLRGWVMHSDGRLYHPFIISQVNEMLRRRSSATQRKRKQRMSRDVTRDAHGTYAKEQDQEQEQERKKETEKEKKSSCPTEKILDLYHEILPELPQCLKLTPARRGYIQQRWREDLPELEHWRNFFAYVRQSPFLMGKVESTNGRRPFVASLEWITKPANFAKIKEETYHG